MKVLVNAISVKEGGSLVVLVRLLRAMVARRPDIEWHAAVHPSVERQSILPNALTLWSFPWVERSPGHLIYWYEVALPRLLRRIRADVLFSQTNYLPRRKLACPTLLLEQHAGHFSPEFRELMERDLGSRASIWAWRRKEAWVQRSVRKANRVTVQTAALAEAIHAQARVPEDRLDVVHHGPGQVAHADHPRTWPAGKPWRIGYVSKFGVQKDFATAVRALREMKDRGRDVMLVLTLNRTAPATTGIDRLATELGVGSNVENHGDLAADAIQSLYDGLDGFVFPSLSESFGFPLVEAMARGLPVVVARTASNVEVAGAGAPVFAPKDWRGLADAVESLMGRPDAYEAQARRSLARGKEFSWDRAAAGTLDAVERAVLR